MTDLTETLTSYVPALVACRLAEDPAPITQPAAEHFSAAVLFADISGFTATTEHLAKRGPSGIEELSRLLNDYFSRLTEIIYAHGGDVVKFAGDAMLAIWPVSDPTVIQPRIGQSSPELPTATLRAAQCALAIQESLHNYSLTEGKTLRMRVAVGVGALTAVHIGGVFQRWEFMLAGDPLVQVGQIEGRIEPGGVILSPPAWEIVAERCQGEILPGLGTRLQKVRAPIALQSLPPIGLPVEAEAALWSYVPGAVRARLAAGQSSWLAELRRLTVLFVNLPDLCYTTPLDKAQHIMYSIQTCLYRYEGSINKISVDEKGSTLVAALGLPPLAHQDDAVRGLRAARDIQASLATCQARNAIGVTTGPVFCGSIGGPQRCEYAILGRTVNLAARLMQAALHHPASALLCDATTWEAAQSQFAFEALLPILVKGHVEPVPIFRPLNEKLTASQSKAEMIGRSVERMRLAQHCQALLSGKSSLIIIEGEAGIGKTRLTEDLQRQAQALGLNLLAGAGDPVERFSPYHAWGKVFARLFELDLLNDLPEQQQLCVKARMEVRHPDLLELMPLLNAILPLDLPDNELTAQLSGEGRANRTHELLMSLLQDSAQTQRLVLVLEDAYWLDSGSWALVKLAWQDVQPLMLVVVMRPKTDPLPMEYTWLCNQPDVDHFRLETLPAEDIERLVCQRLGVAHLPEQVLRLIETKAEGHPFFSEELAYALRDSGLIQVADGECHLATGVGSLASLDFPNTIQGVIISRLDRLPPQQQLALKVASVIGRIFAFRVLCDSYPIEADRPALPEHLRMLEQLDLTTLETPEPDLTYIFKHVIIQEVTYNLMTYVQRRKLHQVVAEWYENTYACDLGPFYPLLAHHWMRVVAGQILSGQDEGEKLLDDPELVAKAVNCIEKAGDLAYMNNANQESINFFSILIDWLKRKDMINVPVLRQAHWERQIGYSYYIQGNLQESRTHLERVVALLGCPLPSTFGGTVLRFLGQSLRQTWLLIRWPYPTDDQKERSTALQEAADAYVQLAQLYYQAEDALRTITASLQALNLAQQSGSFRLMAETYTMTGLAISIIPIHPLARYYIYEGLKAGKQIKDLYVSAWVLEGAGMYDLGLGKSIQVQEHVERAANYLQRLGDRRFRDECIGIWAYGCYLGGQFSKSFDLWVQITQSGTRAQDPWCLVWGLCGQVEVGLPTGMPLKQAGKLMEEARTMLVRGGGSPDQIRAWGISSKIYLLDGEWELARQAAQNGLDLITHKLPTTPYAYEGYACVTETYLALWEAEIASHARNATTGFLQGRARQACAAMWNFARAFPMARARAWLLEGCYAWLAGWQRRAKSYWQKSLAEARRRSMPYEEGLAHLEIGRHLPQGDPVHNQNLEQAVTIFERVGAIRDKMIAQKAME